MTKEMIQSLKTILLALVIGIGVTISAPSYGWNPPVSLPPSDNSESPLLEDGSFQAKNGPYVSSVYLDIFGTLLSNDLVVSGISDFNGTFTSKKFEDLNRTEPHPICINALGELELCS